MYNKIECEFKEKSKYRKIQITYIVTIVIYIFLTCVTVFGILFKFQPNIFIEQIDNKFVYIFLSEIISILFFYIMIYIYMAIMTRKNENFSFLSAISDHKMIINLFWEQIYQKDIKILVKILKDNSINTRPKTLEAIRHYQTLIPRNLEITSQVVSVIAIAISLIALIFDDKIFYSAENLAIVLVFIILIIILYLAFRSYNKILLKMFGKSEFYKRLELTLSEIYMRSLIK